MSFNNVMNELGQRFNLPFRFNHNRELGLLIDCEQQIDLHISDCGNYLDLIAPLACIEDHSNVELYCELMKKNFQMLKFSDVFFAINSDRDELCLRRTLRTEELDASLIWHSLIDMVDIAKKWIAWLLERGMSGLR